MRDLIAVALVALLVVAALRMATALQGYRRGRERRRERLDVAGRSLVAEVPVPEGLEFFAEDGEAFYWAERRIPKDEIRSAQVRFGDLPLATVRARRFPAPAEAGDAAQAPPAVEQERWDVAIETADDTVVVACGAIREHVSQDLARRIFEAVRQAVEAGDRAAQRPVS